MRSPASTSVRVHPADTFARMQAERETRAVQAPERVDLGQLQTRTRIGVQRVGAAAARIYAKRLDQRIGDDAAMNNCALPAGAIRADLIARHGEAPTLPTIRHYLQLAGIVPVARLKPVFSEQARDLSRPIEATTYTLRFVPKWLADKLAWHLRKFISKSAQSTRRPGRSTSPPSPLGKNQTESKIKAALERIEQDGQGRLRHYRFHSAVLSLLNYDLTDDERREACLGYAVFLGYSGSEARKLYRDSLPRAHDWITGRRPVRKRAQKSKQEKVVGVQAAYDPSVLAADPAPDYDPELDALRSAECREPEYVMVAGFEVLVG